MTIASQVPACRVNSLGEFSRFVLRSAISATLPFFACTFAASGAEELIPKISAVSSLSSEVSINLDRFDIPTITASSMLDAACAQGWMHARDRFLQMDLARREAAGELAELVPQGIALDRNTRVLGLRAVARRALAALPAHHRALLERYAEGVNAQLGNAVPLEYKLLRVAPSPWRAEDSILVQLGMARYLDRSASLDRDRGALFNILPASVASFLASSSGALNASVDGSPLPPPPPLPHPDAIDLRGKIGSNADNDATSQSPDRAIPGSNAFAVAGSRTRDGRAIVGNDMHLMLTAPGIWYRVRLVWPNRELTGLSLPGVPLIVQGTNGHVAWGFTNLTADLADLVVVEPDPTDAERYLTESGTEPFESEFVEIGRESERERLDVLRTRYGPIIEKRPDGSLVALRWAPLVDAGAVDCGLFDLVEAMSIEAALETARAWNGPPQNVLVADGRGRIGWTIAGALPDRSARTSAPVSWRSAPAWNGVLPAKAKPIVVDPPSGILVSANQLAMRPEGPLAHVLGADEAAGDRAHRMRELIASRSDWTEQELFKVQLDTRSARLLRWRDALLALASDDAPPPKDAMLEQIIVLLASWDGHCDIDESAPVLLDAARRILAQRVSRAIAATPTAVETGTDASAIESALEDEAILRMLEEHQPHLLPDAAGWQDLAREVLVEAAARVRDGEGKFATHGDMNRASIRHPAADALGAAARVAEMPKAPLPGHPTSVRVQTPRFGASQRSVVSPGHLGDAILVTPCGQSGIPTSPHFRNLHKPWQDGEPFPLLPGETAAKVSLLPAMPGSTGPTSISAPAAELPAPEPVSPSNR